VQWRGKGSDVSSCWAWFCFCVLEKLWGLTPCLGRCVGLRYVLANKTGCQWSETAVAVVTRDVLYTSKSYTSQMLPAVFCARPRTTKPRLASFRPLTSSQNVCCHRLVGSASCSVQSSDSSFFVDSLSLCLNRIIMSMSNPGVPPLPPSQARLAALNRLKAKDRLTAPTSATTAGGSSRDGANARGPAQGYVNKPVAGPSSSRNALAEQSQDKSGEAPLRRDPGLVSTLGHLLCLGVVRIPAVVRMWMEDRDLEV
jgi:DNA-repair protein complementing XP-A cells